MMRFWKQTGRPEFCAVKIIDKTSPRARQVFEDEVRLLKLLAHPHVLPFIESYETADEFFIMTQVRNCLGSLPVGRENVKFVTPPGLVAQYLSGGELGKRVLRCSFLPEQVR